MHIHKPNSEEVGTYFFRYIDLVEEGDVLGQLRKGEQDMQYLMGKLTDAQWDHRYEEGKWSVREAVLHQLDTERIFCTRALRIARGDQTPLPGFSQDDYIPFLDAEERSPISIREEYRRVRAATLAFFENLSEAAYSRQGIASGNPLVVRAVPYILAGHEVHHINIYRERYGLSAE